MSTLRIISVIVAYRPEIEKLEKIVDALAMQCAVLIVDNSSDERVSEIVRRRVGVFYISMGTNMGIAAAQNKGVQFSESLGFNVVLLMDDDSMPSPSLCKELVANYQSLLKTNANGHVVVCATAIDAYRNSHARTGRNALAGIHPLRELMSAGSLISIDTFRIVGMFEESLFVDCVDYEWGWRARRLGVQIYAIDSAIIFHRLGLGVFNFFGLHIGKQHPIRHYYQYRNVVRLLQRSYVPWQWKVRQGLSLVLKPLFFVVMGTEKIERLKFMFKGVIDGVKGRGGPCPT